MKVGDLKVAMSVPNFQHFYTNLQNIDLFVRFDNSFFEKAAADLYNIYFIHS